MSDLMLHGVLNMPLPNDPAELDVVTWVQFKDRAAQASQRIEELEAKLAKAVAELDRLGFDWECIVGRQVKGESHE